MKILLLLQILPNTIPCHCPVSWNSYFNGIALELARGKQRYLRKAKFLLHLHLADTKSTNTNQSCHICASLTSAWVTQTRSWQRHPHLARHRFSLGFLQPTQTNDAQNQLINICWTCNFTDFPQAKKKEKFGSKKPCCTSHFSLFQHSKW